MNIGNEHALEGFSHTGCTDTACGMVYHALRNSCAFTPVSTTEPASRTWDSRLHFPLRSIQFSPAPFDRVRDDASPASADRIAFSGRRMLGTMPPCDILLLTRRLHAVRKMAADADHEDGAAMGIR